MIFNNGFFETDNEFRNGVKNKFPYHVYKTITPNGATELTHFHWHPEVEIAYSQTTGILRIEKQFYDIKKEDIFFINPRQLHNNYKHEEPGILYGIVFFAEALKSNYQPNYQNDLINGIINRKIQFMNKIEQTSEAYRQILPVIKEIINIIEMNIDDEYRGFLVQSVFNKLFYFCCKCDVFIKMSAKDEIYKEYIMDAMDYIQKNYMNIKSIKDVASHINISESYLFKIFKIYCGISPVEYINSIRINSAYDLLQKRIPVMETAAAVGFSNVSYFIRLFKNATGKTPYQWLKIK
jgi:AraC-like DNA-binding protein